MKSLGVFKLSLDATTVKTLTDACGGTLPQGIQAVAMQAETADIRFKDDKRKNDMSNDPTSTSGLLLKAGVNPVFWQTSCGNLRFVGTATAVLNISVYG